MKVQTKAARRHAQREAARVHRFNVRNYGAFRAFLIRCGLAEPAKRRYR